MQNRLKSKVVWLAVLAQIVLVLGLYATPELTENVKIVATAIIEILTVVGILNNPTDKENW